MSLRVVLKEILIQPMPPGFVTPGGFDCTKPDMNKYLSDGDAERDRIANYSHTFVAYFNDQFIGYVSLLTDAIRLEGKERPKGIGYPTAPAVKIGRLAVCKSVQEQGVGQYLLKYVAGMVRADMVGKYGCRFLTLDSHLDKEGWYRKYDFVPNSGQSLLQKLVRKFYRKTPLTEPMDAISMRYDLFAPEVPIPEPSGISGEGP